jgi:hypothetical protein
MERGGAKVKYNDYPLEECKRAAKELNRKGLFVYQKFTCSGCGRRLTMDVANTFFTEGSCDNCPTVTNIERQGCNYMVTNLELKK